MQTLDLPWVEEGRRAQRIAKQVLQRAQYRGKFSATFNMKALGCEVGDVVYLSFEPLGWADKPFRVMTQNINSTGQVPMTLIEENAAIYAWDAEEQALVTPTAPTVYDPLNSPYILAISDAEAAADGKIVSFFQTSAPTAQGVGDIWFDTDDGNKMYRWNGSSWAAAQDTLITIAISDAANAQATADGKVNTYFQASAPTPEAIGDLWIETDAQNRLWRWNGSTWVLATDTRVTAAINTDGTIAGSAVITTSIASNAVSKLTAASSTTSLTINSTPTTIQTVTITTDGGPIIIRATFQNYSQPIAAGAHGIQFQITSSGAGGTQLYYSTEYATAGGSGNQFRQPCTLETLVASLAAGTYTINLVAQLFNANSQAATLTADRIITVTELKR